MNYSELSTAIQDYCQNSETSFLSHLNEFIIAAEDKVFEAVNGAPYFKTSTGITTASAQHYYDSSDGIPDGIQDILGIRLCETASGNIETGGPMRYLLRRDYDFLWEAYPGTASGPETGVPKYYATKTAISNSGEANIGIFMFPSPSDIFNTEIEYQGKLTTDSITSGSTPAVPLTTTTWLSTSFPSTLLYGALVQGYTYMKGEQDVMAQYQKNFDQGILLLKNLTESRQTTDDFKSNETGAQ
jgi:hypothetical protein